MSCKGTLTPISVSPLSRLLKFRVSAADAAKQLCSCPLFAFRRRRRRRTLGKSGPARPEALAKKFFLSGGGRCIFACRPPQQRLRSRPCAVAAVSRPSRAPPPRRHACKARCLPPGVRRLSAVIESNTAFASMAAIICKIRTPLS